VYLHRAEVPKLVRWRLRLQEYDFTVEHIPGKENVVADTLSRYCTECKPVVGTITATVSHKISTFHNATVGHRDVTATVKILHEAGEEWPLMAKDVAEFIQNCPYCQKNRPFDKVSWDQADH
jgi:tRNA A-37 threonylcarbamoyl transferase component Bud32